MNPAPHFSAVLLRVLLALFCWPALAFAQTSSVPALINYQGRATDASGAVLGTPAPVNRTIIFRIWDSPSSTAPANRLYSEQQNVTITGGDFSVMIGAGTPVAADVGNPYSSLSGALFGGVTRFLGITIDDGDGNLANDPEGSPRQQIVSGAFALRAQIAESVTPGAVTSAALASNAVTGAALAAGSVTSAKISNGVVGTTQLADSAVTPAKLAAAAVGTAQLADGAVTSAKLAGTSLDATKLAAGAITLAKVGTDAVTSAKIVDGSIGSADFAAGAVETAKLADSSVSSAKLAANSVDGTKLVDGSVATADIATGAVDAATIAAGAVGHSHLNTAARDAISRGRTVYEQGIDPDYVTKRQKGRFLFPIDLAEWGNDADGCVISYIVQHNFNYHDWRTGNVAVYITQPGFVNDPNYPNLIWCRARNLYYTGVIASNFRLGVTTWATSGRSNNGDTIFESGDNWVSFYNFFPGSLRSGNPAPFNANQDNNASNLNAGGPPITNDVVSAVPGAGALTVTLRFPHAIQVGDTVTIAGLSGAGDPTGDKVVTAIPDRSSFTIALAGAAGSYSGGTVTYKPTYNKFRIWAAVHPDVSARIIVSDR